MKNEEAFLTVDAARFASVQCQSLTICAFIVPLSNLINHSSWELLVAVMIVKVLLQPCMVPPQPPLTAQAYVSFLSIMCIELPPSITNLLAQTTNEAHV